jgi:formylmethanofuran dehydrogenase subunit C
MKYIVTDADGVILRYGEVPEFMFGLQAQDGEVVIEGTANDALQYVLDGAVVAKHNITASLFGTTLSGLPVPCVVEIEGTKYEVADGSAELSFSLPGTYQVKVEARHHLPKTFEVTA